MGVLSVVLLVIFCIISILLIFLVAIQDEKSSGLGGIFGGGAEKAFGGNTGAFITKTTTVLAICFMVLSLVVAIVNKSSDADVLKAIEAQSAQEAQTTTWLDSDNTDSNAVSDSTGSEAANN